MATPSGGVSTPIYDFSIITRMRREEDHYFDIRINETCFAIFDKAIEWSGDISIDLKGYHVILLEEITATELTEEESLSIEATSVIAFALLKAPKIDINITDRLFFLPMLMDTSTCKIRAKSMVDCSPIDISIKKAIIDAFKKGVAGNNRAIMDALNLTYFVIANHLRPEGTKPLENVLRTEVCKFFDIPIRVKDIPELKANDVHEKNA